jgi:hypothetical protein
MSLLEGKELIQAYGTTRSYEDQMRDLSIQETKANVIELTAEDVDHRDLTMEFDQAYYACFVRLNQFTPEERAAFHRDLNDGIAKAANAAIKRKMEREKQQVKQ